MTFENSGNLQMVMLSTSIFMVHAIAMCFAIDRNIRVSINGATPKSSMLIGCSFPNHFGVPPFMETHVCISLSLGGLCERGSGLC